MNKQCMFFPHCLRAPAGLWGLLLLASTSRAQTVANASGSSLYQTSDLYAVGTVQNAGSYLPSAGTLLIKSGDFTNSGTIGTSAVNGTVKLLEASATQGHTVTLGGQALPNLTLDVPAGTSLGSVGTVNGTLTLLNGHLLTTATNTLTLGPTATIVGETNAHYVKGRLAQNRTLSGMSVFDFGSIGFTANPNGNSLPLSVERRTGMLRPGMSYASNPSMSQNQSIDRIWALSSTTATSASPVTVTFAWLADNDNGLSFAGANAQIWRSDDNGSTWQRQGVAQNGSNHTVTADITSLNALYTVGSTAAPLPVTLTDFTAQLAGQMVQLSWRTASEQNANRFEVERSLDAATFTRLGAVAAAGTSSSAHTYAFPDAQLPTGAATLYYRLRQVDVDGTSTYSPVRTVAFTPAAAGLALFPNPVRQLTALTGAAAYATVQVVDALGRTLTTGTADADGTAQLRLPAGLTPGVYVVRTGTQALRLLLE